MGVRLWRPLWHTSAQMFLKYSPGSRDNLLQGQVCAVVYLTIIVIVTIVWDNLRLCGTLYLIYILNKVVNCEQSRVFKSLDFVSGLYNCLEFSHSYDSCVYIRDRSLFIARWGGGGRGNLGLNKVKFSRPPFECYFAEVLPPNNIWWPSRSPPHHVFIFQTNLSGPPSESFQSLHWSRLLGSQLRLIPPFVLLKIKWSPPSKSSAPQAINNDRSLRLCKHGYYSWEKICITFVPYLSWVF